MNGGHTEEESDAPLVGAHPRREGVGVAVELPVEGRGQVRLRAHRAVLGMDAIPSFRHLFYTKVLSRAEKIAHCPVVRGKSEILIQGDPTGKLVSCVSYELGCHSAANQYHLAS